MRISIITLQLVILVLFVMCGKVTEKFTCQPEYPQPGQEISITYNPSGTSLDDADEVTLLAYCFPEGNSVVKEIDMEKSAGVWHGAFTTADTTLAVYIIFRSGEQQDNNDKNGYLVSLFTSDNKPVKGGLARQAEVAIYSGAFPLRLYRDFEKANDYFEKEFEFYPKQEQNWKIVNSYWYIFHNLHRDSATTIIKARLEKLGHKEEKTHEELSVLINWHQEFNDKTLADKYEKELLKREPKGYHAEFEHFMECAKEISIDNKRKLTLAFIEDFPNSEYIEQLHDRMISAYVEKELYKEAENYFDTYVKDPSSEFLDNLAWAMVKGEIMLERAVELAEIAVKKARTEQETEEKPGHYTQKEWQEEQNRSLAYVLDTYGFGLHKLGKIEESVSVFEEAVELSQRKSKGIRERYCRSLYETGQIEKAFTEMESLIKEEPSKQELRTFFKEVYIKYKGSEDGLELIFIEAEKEHRIKKQKEIKEQMIEKPAPAFALNDLDSNTVNLADFKGKIVVLDFWGTWCGVCLQSFPAMQQSVNKYKEDGRIKFLFIDTLEKIEDAEKKVREIINNNNYTFHVLLDVNNSVANDYKITSAPIKIIIGPNGNIRFRIKGYGGDETELIEKLDMMIAILR